MSNAFSPPSGSNASPPSSLTNRYAILTSNPGKGNWPTNVIGSLRPPDIGQNGSSSQNGWPPSFAIGSSIGALLGRHDISRRGDNHRSNGPVADADRSDRSSHAMPVPFGPVDLASSQ